MSNYCDCTCVDTTFYKLVYSLIDQVKVVLSIIQVTCVFYCFVSQFELHERIAAHCQAIFNRLSTLFYIKTF